MYIESNNILESNWKQEFMEELGDINQNDNSNLNMNHN